jgi:alkylation response protein AidB-like acyl-CoA dehydrogenase
MDFRLTDEQSALRDGARQLLGAECSPDLVRARYEDRNAIPAELFAHLTEQDWPGLLVPEAYGGLGLGVIELCLLLEEAGRVLVPGPLWSTAGLFVPFVLACAGKEQRGDVLTAVVDGAAGTVACAGADGVWSPSDTATVATADGERWTITGTKRLVPEAETARWVVVSATTPDGPSAFLVERDDVTCTWVETVDRSCALFEVTLDESPAVRLTDATADSIERALEVARVTLAAELVGSARWILDATVAYAKVREQFDVPIGSFQAVQHHLANDLLELERASAGVYWAAMILDADSEPHERSRAAAIAKSSAGDAARLLAKDGIQIHGGIGYTWEHDLHLYIRRVYAAEALLGGSSEQRSRLAELLAL